MLDPYCERTRAWTSLELDGELAELERVVLEEHLTRCHECAAFAESIRAVASLVRSAPLEHSERQLDLPARRRPAAVAVRVSAAAAVLALAAGLGFLGSSLGDRAVTETSAEPEIAFLGSVDREIKSLRAKEPAPVRQPVAPPGRQGGFV